MMCHVLMKALMTFVIALVTPIEPDNQHVCLHRILVQPEIESMSIAVPYPLSAPITYSRSTRCLSR
jgi:hypothetical protein